MSAQRILAAGAFLFLAVSAVAETVSPERFVEEVNAAWRQQRYDQMGELIASRLGERPDDPAALCAKMYFHVFAQRDMEVARSTADLFVSSVRQLGGEESGLVLLAEEMRTDISRVPPEEGQAFSEEQRSAMHALFPNEFPMAPKCLGIARLLEPA